MSEENLDIPMAQCGACNSIVPLDSESCPGCGVRFGGVSDEQLGECGACGAIIPADSESCPECGASFVAVEQTQVDEPTEDSVAIATSEDLEELNDLILPENEVVETVEEVDDSPGAEDDAGEADQPESETNDGPVEEEVEEVNQTESEVSSESVEVEEEADIDSFIDDVEELNVDENPEPVEGEESVEEEHSSDESTEEDVQESTLEEETETEESSETAVEEEAEEESSEEVTEEEDSEEEKPVEEAIEDTAIAMAFDNLALAIADSGMTAAEAFGEIDTSDDQLIDAPELQKGIEKIAGEKLSPKHVTAILNHLDKDGNRRVDPNELIKALEDLRIGIQPGKVPKIKTFPSPIQKFLMGKKANDIFYPIAYFLMITFIGVWVVNGMGLLVDGTGGTIVYEGGVDEYGDEIDVTNWNLCQSDVLEEIPDPCFGSVAVGETYPCDPAVDPDKCANSLTIFSGENDASSMPAGFYGDGISMIILGVIGVAITAFLHLIYAPALREKAKEKSGNNTVEESVDEDETEEDDSEEDNSALDAPKNLVVEEKYDDVDEAEDDDSEDEAEEDDSEAEEDDEEEIDIGARVGVEDEDGDWFGVVVEFDEDDESLVIVKSEDDDEEYEVEWDMLFIPGDEDDE